MRGDLEFSRAERARPAFSTASTSDNAARFIRAMIFSGELGPDDRLPPSRDLAARLGISIVTLRVALTSLAAAGYVVTSRGARGGSRVSDLPSLTRCWSSWMRGRAQEVDELCELRRTVEVEIARLAAERRTDEDLQAVEDAITLAERTGSSVLRWNVAFHDALACAAHNRRLQRAMVEVRGELFLPVDAYLREHRIEEVVAAHAAILGAVRARDVEVAGERMRAHLAEVQGVIMLSLAETGGV